MTVEETPGGKSFFSSFSDPSTSWSTASELAPGLGIDQQYRRIAAVLIGRAAVIGGADLDAADVPDTGHVSLVAGLDDDVGELLGRRQPAERFDVDLIGLVARDRRLVQNTGRDLQVLRAQRS